MDNIVEDQIDIDNCYECGIELTNKNRSIWAALKSVDGKSTSVSQCVICHEVSGRLLSSCIIKNDKFIPQKTDEECRREIMEEGLTVEILKQNEVDFIQTKQ
jgi:hypothetical protein